MGTVVSQLLNEIPVSMTAWTNPANTMLSERGQVSKANHCVSCLYIDSEGQRPKAEDQS